MRLLVQEEARQALKIMFEVTSKGRCVRLRMLSPAARSAGAGVRTNACSWAAMCKLRWRVHTRNEKRSRRRPANGCRSRWSCLPTQRRLDEGHRRLKLALLDVGHGQRIAPAHNGTACTVSIQAGPKRTSQCRGAWQGALHAGIAAGKAHRWLALALPQS